MALNCCFNCQKRLPKSSMKRCAKCQSVTYCSKECQKANWSLHKPHCAWSRGSPTGKAALKLFRKAAPSAVGMMDEIDEILAAFLHHHKIWFCSDSLGLGVILEAPLVHETNAYKLMSESPNVHPPRLDLSTRVLQIKEIIAVPSAELAPGVQAAGRARTLAMLASGDLPGPSAEQRFVLRAYARAEGCGSELLACPRYLDRCYLEQVQKMEMQCTLAHTLRGEKVPPLYDCLISGFNYRALHNEKRRQRLTAKF